MKDLYSVKMYAWMWGLLFLPWICEGISSCPQTKDGVLNVHFVPHTHDDVGWLKTVDQYYFGASKGYAPTGVQYILDSVISALEEDESRRFIYVEMAFFWRWWKEQDLEKKERVRKLVEEGRLEFINGGWSMNDEASAHYNSIIDQMSLGLRFLNETFGDAAIPTIAWQIDPFGHSKEQANLFALLGFKGLFFGRADYADKTNREREKSMEMIWEGRVNETSIFTGLLPNSYMPPNGFCFDVFCGDEPIIDNPDSPDYNVPQKMADFLKVVQEESDVYKTRHIVMTMGGDFQYTDASMWFKNMDKLMHYFKNENVHIVYSTPSCYLKSVTSDPSIQFPKKTDDFFPYASDEHSYWTGYFTSRPALKGMIRKSNNLLQACKQLDVISGFHSKDIIVMKRAMGVAQHHDAVTGTGKQHVTDDYAMRLAVGAQLCYKVINEAYKVLAGPSIDSHRTKDFEQTFCPLLNITECAFTSERDSDFAVNVYNPLSHNASFPIRFPGNAKFSYDVYDEKGGKVEASVFPLSTTIEKIPGRKSKNFKEVEVLFEATNIPAMSYISYLVKTTKEKIKKTESRTEYVLGDSDFIVNVIFDSNGDIKGVKKGGKVFRLHHDFGYYIGYPGDNDSPQFRSSGAYIFRPLVQKPQKIPRTTKTLRMRKGSNVHEVEIKYGNWTSQVIRVYKNNEFVEFEWLVGPIPVDADGYGKEIVTRYTSRDIHSKGVFYTDSNGRQFLRRRKDYRPTWNLDLSTEGTSRNYYPITSAISVEDEVHRMTVLTDRSQGGTSLKNGRIELMLHRRLLHDDAFGVGEPLNEIAYGEGLVVRGKHWLIFEDTSSRASSRFLALQKYDNAIVSFSNPRSSQQAPLHINSLPKNVHILTLETVSNGILIRFEHYFDKTDDATYSKAASFVLNKVFNEDILFIQSVYEVSLGGNYFVDNKDLSPSSVITLKPMEIRSFLINTPK